MVHFSDKIGEQIKGAMNRIDFYRLYKCVCSHYDLDVLLLIDTNTWPDETHMRSDLVIIEKEDYRTFEFEEINVESDNEIFNEMRSGFIAKCWNSEDTSKYIDFAGDLSAKQAISIPIHTPNSKHLAILAIGSDTFDRALLSELAMICLAIFERYYEQVILPSTLPIITFRELEVIKWSAEGKTSAETAIILGLSEHTVNSYTTKILHKLQVVNRAQMVAKAIRTGLIQ